MWRGEARTRHRTYGWGDGRAGAGGCVRGVLGGVAAGFATGDQPLRPRDGEPGAQGAVEGGDAGVLRAGRGRALARSFCAVRRFAVDVPDEVGQPPGRKAGCRTEPRLLAFPLLNATSWPLLFAARA